MTGHYPKVLLSVRCLEDLARLVPRHEDLAALTHCHEDIAPLTPPHEDLAPLTHCHEDPAPLTPVMRILLY